MVSKELADRNQWSIGDSLTLGFRDETNTVFDQAFIIGGIYQINDVFMNDTVYNYQIPANTVFIPLSTYRAVVRNEYLPLEQLYFHLKHNNPATVKKLESRFHEIGYTNIRLRLYTPENVTAGIAKLLLLLQITSVVVVICGLLVLFVIIFLNMQSRKKEIGILISLGKPAERVIRSLFCEIFIVGILAVLCAVVLFLFSEHISETYIIGYLMSETAAADFVNTTASMFFQNQLQQHAAYDAASAALLPPVFYAVGMCFIVGMCAYCLIYAYMKNIQPMSVFGDEA
ncbi:MAG: ABC transporter permease [Eubacteriales bacterium]